MSSEEEIPSFRARESARRSSGSRRIVVARLDAIHAIYNHSASSSKAWLSEWSFPSDRAHQFRGITRIRRLRSLTLLSRFRCVCPNCVQVRGEQGAELLGRGAVVNAAA